MNCGVVNLPRIAQSQELTKLGTAAGLPTLLFMDSNSDAAQPEMRFLSTHGWEDAWGQAGGETWSRANPLTVTGHLAEPDQRVDYVWSRSAPGAQAGRGDVLVLAVLWADVSVVGCPMCAPCQRQPSPSGMRQVVCQESRVVLDSPPFTSDHFGVSACFSCNF
jgi:hypothetical protein